MPSVQIYNEGVRFFPHSALPAEIHPLREIFNGLPLLEPEAKLVVCLRYPHSATLATPIGKSCRECRGKALCAGRH